MAHSGEKSISEERLIESENESERVRRGKRKERLSIGESQFHSFSCTLKQHHMLHFSFPEMITMIMMMTTTTTTIPRTTTTTTTTRTRLSRRPRRICCWMMVMLVIILGYGRTEGFSFDSSRTGKGFFGATVKRTKRTMVVHTQPKHHLSKSVSSRIHQKDHPEKLYSHSHPTFHSDPNQDHHQHQHQHHQQPEQQQPSHIDGDIFLDNPKDSSTTTSRRRCLRQMATTISTMVGLTTIGSFYLPPIQGGIAGMSLSSSSSSTTTTATTTTNVYTSSRFQNRMVANARGLVQFPCTQPLLNRYHIMRAGTTLLEEQNIWSTNPLFLTNREAALSAKGRMEVERAAQELLDYSRIPPSVIKYSLAASATDTATILKDILQVGQNRLVPEFTFMDPRAIGLWDMFPLEQTQQAIVALDALEGGTDGTGGRPPPKDDGTPHETLADQAIRLRQLLSVLETQYSGDTILLIFPDGTGPALLSAMMAGIPLNRVHELEFQPGEIRFDVTMDRTLAFWKERNVQNQASYQAKLQQGQDELKRLQSMDASTVISRKDLLMEQEQLEIEEEYQRKQKIKQQRQEEKELRERMERLQQEERRIAEGRDSSDTVPPLLIAGALGAFVIATSARDEKITLDAEQESPVSSAKDGSGVTGITMDDASEANNLPLKERSLFYDNSVPKTEEERLLAAKDAMQAYLDEDDGGEAWLQAMEEIIHGVGDGDEDDEVWREEFQASIKDIDDESFIGQEQDKNIEGESKEGGL